MTDFIEIRAICRRQGHALSNDSERYEESREKQQNRRDPEPRITWRKLRAEQNEISVAITHVLADLLIRLPLFEQLTNLASKVARQTDRRVRDASAWPI